MPEQHTTETEIWRPIWGWWTIYQVSTLGRVMRIKRGRATQAGRILVPQPDGSGYLQVGFCNGRYMKRTYKVHFLVADTFIGPRPHRLVINHKSGNHQDNRLANLEYVTTRENILHGYHELGRRRLFGTANGRALVTQDQVDHIRALYASGDISQQAIADQFSVSQQCISSIVQRINWRDHHS